MANHHRELSRSPQRTVIISVTLVGLLATSAAVYDYLHLEAAHQQNVYSRFAMIPLSIFLSCYRVGGFCARGSGFF